MAVALAALVGLAAVAFAGCYPLTEFAPPKTPVTLPPIIHECKQPVEASFVTLVGSVAEDADWQAELAKLVAETSLCAVRVAAQQVIDGMAGAKAQQTVDVAGRLKVWLADHPNTGGQA